MPNWVLVTFIAANFIFLVSGILILVVSLMFQKAQNSPQTVTTAGSSILLSLSPLDLGIVNAVLIFLTVALSLPGLLMPQVRGWLRAHSWMVLLAALISLITGLDIWFGTLQTRANLSTAWGNLPAASQSQLQQSFKCCGYLNPVNPPFVTDSVCTDPATAARLGGCVGPFGSFANQFLDIVFTAMFGAVALDVIVFFSSVVLLKDRAEQERYRMIDRKFGAGAL